MADGLFAQVEQQEQEAEEEGGTMLGKGARVVMDVDSGHLEGEHLTQVGSLLQPAFFTLNSTLRVCFQN